MKTLLLLAALVVAQVPVDVADPPPAAAASTATVAAPAVVVIDEPTTVVPAASLAAAAAAQAAAQPLPEGDVAIVHAALDVLARLDLGNLFSVGTLALLITVLTMLSRLGFVGAFLAEKQLGWVRPLIAVVLGAASGAIGALQNGTPVLTGIFGGLLVGLTSIGAFESLRLISPKARDEVRISGTAATVAAAPLEDRATAAAVKAEVSSTAVNEKIANAAMLSPGKRLEELAKLATNPALAEVKTASK